MDDELRGKLKYIWFNSLLENWDAILGQAEQENFSHRQLLCHIVMSWDQPIENAVRQMEVNVNALFYAIHAVLPEMMERNDGHIVNVSSGTAVSSFLRSSLRLPA
jgi:NAD(P)-dependent dehydrogenase (short-subunit alcohol dehydrogenase family)